MSRERKPRKRTPMPRGFLLFLIGALAIAPLDGAMADKHPKPSAKPAKPASDPVQDVNAPLDPQLAIQMANDYFNAARVMTADFVQVGADGRRSEGKLYVLKPGRLRFEYAMPATMEIIADGVSVAIRDRKLKSQQLYFISQTPLKFLLQDKINLAKDVKVTNVSSTGQSVIITIEDKSTFGGSSIIKLDFDRKDFTLNKWQVTDPQGYDTLVTLHNIDLTTVPDLKLFRIPPTSIWPSFN
ncbi:outer-membrane lipoprotein carrier protein LolA [Rhodoblastus sp.]|uniref:outer-membrane lipoprotein carrier protein LolA n=1 Tax=Rhodoblastus sp. TaxID=1962975 RepID=UPI003F9754FA